MIISVVNSKGGVGKSTLTVHLAAWMSEQGLRTAVVDADPQASTSRWLAKADPDVPLFPIHAAAALLQRLPELRDEHDVVIADGPASCSAENAALIASADLCLLPIGPSMLDVWASYRIARMIYRIRFHSGLPDRPRAFTIITRAPRGRQIAKIAATAIHHFGFPTARQTVPYREAFLESCAAGTVVWKLGARGRTAGQELERLFVEVLDATTAPSAVVKSSAPASHRTG